MNLQRFIDPNEHQWTSNELFTSNEHQMSELGIELPGAQGKKNRYFSGTSSLLGCSHPNWDMYRLSFGCKDKFHLCSWMLFSKFESRNGWEITTTEGDRLLVSRSSWSYSAILKPEGGLKWVLPRVKILQWSFHRYSWAQEQWKLIDVILRYFGATEYIT